MSRCTALKGTSSGEKARSRPSPLWGLQEQPALLKGLPLAGPSFPGPAGPESGRPRALSPRLAAAAAGAPDGKAPATRPGQRRWAGRREWLGDRGRRDPKVSRSGCARGPRAFCLERPLGRGWRRTRTRGEGRPSGPEPRAGRAGGGPGSLPAPRTSRPQLDLPSARPATGRTGPGIKAGCGAGRGAGGEEQGEASGVLNASRTSTGTHTGAKVRTQDLAQDRRSAQTHSPGLPFPLAPGSRLGSLAQATYTKGHLACRFALRSRLFRSHLLPRSGLRLLLSPAAWSRRGDEKPL
ncbi:unnamed protein product [Rangifer tarandus platyrhynchus]|uniref:Uncharacterized protein n=2 Tax=Rangifer tarandus platyrhynchus TaxID=3082113 RepID=A0ACB0F6L4_RANTA|nr:unnamed protein product [Rangifer tarandus platyrhynchus]CAI9708665.1 unnamed protein product [Rangifer tarandus platyrhynchus]